MMDCAKLFPLNDSNHEMVKRSFEKYKVIKAKTERYKCSAVINIQRMLNKEVAENIRTYKNIGVAGGWAAGALAPPWKNQLVWQDNNGILAGQKWDLGRTEIGAWQDRNGSLAGQK